MLAALRPHCSQIIFVSNGALCEDGRNSVSDYADEVIERENVGFDVWAYKTTLEHCGWEKLSSFDEVVMMNHTIMGPLYPFDEVFGEMDSRTDLDFWGLTLYHGSPYNPYKKCRYKFLPLHLQSHFIAVRKSLLTSTQFRRYWDRMPKIRSYEESVSRHEAVFTKIFEDLGFRWAAYVDTTDMLDHDSCPILFAPVRIIREKRCPVFKRRSFFHDYDDLCRASFGDQGRQLLELLKSEKLFDTDMIWENILRTCNMADIMRCLCLSSTLSEKESSSEPQSVKTALIMHLYYEEQFRMFYRYALSMPENADVYITTSSEEKRAQLLEIFSAGPWNHTEVRITENRGRDVSALLVGCADIVYNYELVCFVHDKKSHMGEYGIMGESFLEHCCNNVLANRDYVGNVISLFREEKHMGMLFAPPPCLANNLSIVANEWTINRKSVEDLAKLLGLTVPISFDKEPIAPLGTMFWFRPEALRILFDYGWKYSDFPGEPNRLDGTILHAVERIYPFVAQQSGYYPMWCLTEEYARRYSMNIYHTLRRERIMYGKGPLSNILRIRIKRTLKSIAPKKLWDTAKRLYRAMGGRKWVG